MDFYNPSTFEAACCLPWLICILSFLAGRKVGQLTSGDLGGLPLLFFSFSKLSNKGFSLSLLRSPSCRPAESGLFRLLGPPLSRFFGHVLFLHGGILFAGKRGSFYSGIFLLPWVPPSLPLFSSVHVKTPVTFITADSTHDLSFFSVLPQPLLSR